MPSQTFLQRTAQNSFRKCNAASCNFPRSGLSAWCSKCLPKADRLGHPNATALKPSQWKSQRAEVAALFTSNADHQGLQQALRWLQGWMTTASEDESSFRGAQEIARLVRAGITPEAILIEVCSFWLWSVDTDHRWPSQRAQDFALARSVFGLSPRPRRATAGSAGCGSWGRSATGTGSFAPKALPSALAYVGAHLRACLAALLVNVADGAKKQRLMKTDPQALMRSPFVLPFPASR